MSVNKLLTFINHNHDRRQLIAGRSEYNCIKFTLLRVLSNLINTIVHSAIHKAAGSLQHYSQKPPSTVLPAVGTTLRDCSPFSGIVQGKAGNGSASGFVNSAVSNWLFPKSHWLELPPPPEAVPAGSSHSQPMGHFSVETME